MQTSLWFAIGGLEAALSAPQSDGTATTTGKWVRIEPKPVEIDGHVYSPTCSQTSGGMPFVDWLEKFLSDQPLPDSMMCTDCLSPLKK